MLVYNLTNHVISIDNNMIDIHSINDSGTIDLKIKSSIPNQFDVFKTGFISETLQITSDSIIYNGEDYKYSILELSYNESNKIKCTLMDPEKILVFTFSESLDSIEVV